MNSLYLKEGEILTENTIASKIEELGKINDIYLHVKFYDKSEKYFLHLSMSIFHREKEIWSSPYSLDAGKYYWNRIYEDFREYFEYEFEKTLNNHVTRVEVIGEGREYVRYDCKNVSFSYQDDGQTLKIFVK